MFRTVALGVIFGLAGLGAIAAAARKSPPPPPDVVMPVVAGNKVDRLPLLVDEFLPTDARKLDVAYIPPSRPAGRPSLPPSQGRAVRPHQVIAPHHRHDPHDPKAKAAKQGTSSTKQVKMRFADQPAKQVSQVKQCRSDGLEPLFQKAELGAALQFVT